MVHSISFYFVIPEKATALLDCLREGVGYALLRQMQPELVGLDFLRSRQSPAVYVCTEFWLYPDACILKERSASYTALVGLLSGVSTGRIDFGAFSFPARSDGECPGAAQATLLSTELCGKEFWS